MISSAELQQRRCPRDRVKCSASTLYAFNELTGHLVDGQAKEVFDLRAGDEHGDAMVKTITMVGHVLDDRA